MAAVVDEEKCVLGFVVFDQAAHAHHELEVGVLRGNGENVGIEGKVFSETSLQIFQLWEDKQVVGTPV